MIEKKASKACARKDAALRLMTGNIEAVFGKAW
jgi:hypothetical protein